MELVNARVSTQCVAGEADQAGAKQETSKAHMRLHKALTFSGLTIELFEDELDEEVIKQPMQASEEKAQVTSTPGK